MKSKCQYVCDGILPHQFAHMILKGKSEKKHVLDVSDDYIRLLTCNYEGLLHCFHIQVRGSTMQFNFIQTVFDLSSLWEENHLYPTYETLSLIDLTLMNKVSLHYLLYHMNSSKLHI